MIVLHFKLHSHTEPVINLSSVLPSCERRQQTLSWQERYVDCFGVCCTCDLLRKTPCHSTLIIQHLIIQQVILAAAVYMVHMLSSWTECYYVIIASW